MITRGCVLDLENSMDLEPDAAMWLDQSRYGNNGTITAGTGGWAQLPSGLWVMQFAGDGQAGDNVADFRIGDYQGSILVWFNTSIGGKLFASCDTASTARYLFLEIEVATGYLRVGQRNVAATNIYEVQTDYRDDLWHQAVLVSTGAAWIAYIDGVVQVLVNALGANNGNWFADTPDRDNWYFGAYIRSTTAYYTGLLGMPKILNFTVTPGQIRNIYESEKYLFGVFD